MQEKHNNHINGVLIILAILLVGGLLWYVIASSGDTYTATPTDTQTGVVQGGEKLYKNSAYGFSFRYDERFEMVPVTGEDPWRFNSTYPGNRLITLSLPRTILPNTNFSEAQIIVGVSTDPTAVKNCLIAENGEVLQEVTKEFTVFALGDAGAGNFYETESYRTVRNNTCIALERMIHSTNILNYDEGQGVSEFDRTIVDTLLTRVITSFRFTN